MTTPTPSWVIISKDTGQAIMETFSKATADRVNRAKYEVIPILAWLQSLNEPNEGRLL